MEAEATNDGNNIKWSFKVSGCSLIFGCFLVASAWVSSVNKVVDHCVSICIYVFQEIIGGHTVK